MGVRQVVLMVVLMLRVVVVLVLVMVLMLVVVVVVMMMLVIEMPVSTAFEFLYTPCTTPTLLSARWTHGSRTAQAMSSECPSRGNYCRMPRMTAKQRRLYRSRTYCRQVGVFVITLC